MPFLLASHPSPFPCGLQPGLQGPGRKPRRGPLGGSELAKVMETCSRQPCSQLWPVVTERGCGAYSCQILPFLKRRWKSGFSTN